MKKIILLLIASLGTIPVSQPLDASQLRKHVKYQAADEREGRDTVTRGEIKTTHEVKIVGQMKDVMWKGQLQGTIHLDTIANKTHLYGLGPVEYLTGEILILDGQSYKSTVVSETAMRVEKTYDLKAPFFGYATITQWSKQALPDYVQTIPQLDQYLDQQTNNSPHPYLFKLSGTIEEATIHIVNLPKGSKVSSPAEAHQGQQNYGLTNEQADIVGFFSTEHKAIFTHHDTYVHMHLITKDRQKMGHLDEVRFKKGGTKLYLPTE
ncbi:acetolactate decarboxylase [Rhabdobacter roseus]|uniref:Alpha-acetolactate decarboxylase n=1 Tax=Rhabdobacter roseus TaxID=1655419 RepID=A0A840TVR8_9BACT|nr:acetolactate decarboxylase [Rhabdobacter roseus]MBB5283749.1 acetolactate decarboxylase [Rhabdobacter roseus]